jgi:hypothetical protein
VSFRPQAAFALEEIWDSFVAISKALEACGFLEGPCVHIHGNLREYNLLAGVRNSTSVEITSIIDWEEAIFAPQFMAFRAPFWLWISENSSTGSDDLEND